MKNWVGTKRIFILLDMKSDDLRSLSFFKLKKIQSYSRGQLVLKR